MELYQWKQRFFWDILLRFLEISAASFLSHSVFSALILTAAVKQYSSAHASSSECLTFPIALHQVTIYLIILGDFLAT